MFRNRDDASFSSKHVSTPHEVANGQAKDETDDGWDQDVDDERRPRAEAALLVSGLFVGSNVRSGIDVLHVTTLGFVIHPPEQACCYST